MFHEDIRIVSKTTFFERATTACMLARSLQVYYSFYTPPLKLCNYVFFYYLCGVRSCHRENLVCHPEELSILTSFLNYFNSSYVYIKKKKKKNINIIEFLITLLDQIINFGVTNNFEENQCYQIYYYHSHLFYDPHIMLRDIEFNFVHSRKSITP